MNKAAMYRKRAAELRQYAEGLRKSAAIPKNVVYEDYEENRRRRQNMNAAKSGLGGAAAGSVLGGIGGRLLRNRHVRGGGRFGWIPQVAALAGGALLGAGAGYGGSRVKSRVNNYIEDMGRKPGV